MTSTGDLVGTLQYLAPESLHERTGKDLGDGSEFKFDWKMNEAIVLSFDGAPPRVP